MRIELLDITLAIQQAPQGAPPQPAYAKTIGKAGLDAELLSARTIDRVRLKVRAKSSPALAFASQETVKVRASRGGGTAASPLDQSPGVPIPPNVRQTLEPAFGRDFGDVRLHVDANAAMAASALRAEAFTLGRDIYFGRGYYDPGSPRGVALIGHELTHVAQDSGSIRRAPVVGCLLPDGKWAPPTFWGSGFHGDKADPKDVFEHGFRGGGRDWDLDKHRMEQSDTTKGGTAFMGTTRFIGNPGGPDAGPAAIDWAGAGGYVYEIDGVPLWDTQKLLDPFVERTRHYGGLPNGRMVVDVVVRGECEFATARNIPRERIKGCWLVVETANGRLIRERDDKGEFIFRANPNYVPGGRWSPTGDMGFPDDAPPVATATPQPKKPISVPWWRRLFGRGPVRTKSFEVAGNDGFEQQAVANEHAILAYLSGGVADLGPLTATPGAGLSGRGKIRRAGEGNDGTDAAVRGGAGASAAAKATGGLSNAELLALPELDFWNIIKDWDADTFARRLYDDATSTMIDPELNAKFRQLLRHTRDRMMDELDEATRMALKRGEFNMKDTPGILKKLREEQGKKLADVSDMIRGRIDLKTYEEEELRAMMARLKQKYPNANTEAFNLAIDDAKFGGAHYRGRFNLKQVRDIRGGTNMKFELQTGAEWVTKFYEDVKVLMPGGGELNIHDAMYKGADQVERIVKDLIKAGKPPLSPEQLEALKRDYDLLEKAYVASLKEVIANFVKGEKASAEEVRLICTKTGYLEASERFFNEPRVHWLIETFGKKEPPVGMEKKIWEKISTAKAGRFAEEMSEAVKAAEKAAEAAHATPKPSWVKKALSAVGDRLEGKLEPFEETLVKKLGALNEAKAAGQELSKTDRVLLSVLEGEAGFVALSKSFRGVAAALKAGEGIGKILWGFSRVLIRGASFLLHVLGPVLSGLALAVDFAQFMEGTQSLAKYCRTTWAKQQLEQKTTMGELIFAQYWAPVLMLDLVDFVSSIAMFFFPPAKTVGLAAGLARLAWGGFTPKWGLGLPAVEFVARAENWVAEKISGKSETPVRKRRGSSRFEDDDPEIARQFRETVDRHGQDPGVSLDLFTKTRLEAFLGVDLGEVRVHTGPVARELSRATEADAITLGRDVYITPEKLGSIEGAGLLAHEVTHVAQARPETPTVSPRALGAGAGVEAMEDVARSIEKRFVSGPAAPARFSVMAEPVVREAPMAPPAVALQAPRTADSAPAPAAVPAPAPAAVHRRAQGEAASLDQKPGFDPVQAVMKNYSVPPGVSQDEFLEICKERVLELLKEELASDAERRETLSLDSSLPLV